MTIPPTDRCLFCGRDGFDLNSLKDHLIHGDCVPFANAELSIRAEFLSLLCRVNISVVPLSEDEEG